MNGRQHTGEIGEGLAPLALINRVTVALSMAAGTDQLVETLAAALTSPEGLGFSRAVLLTYDERRECFCGRLAAGISNAEQARHLVEQFEAEQEHLNEISSSLTAQVPGNWAELLELLRNGSLWIETTQPDRLSVLQIEGLQDLCLAPVHDRSDGLLTRLTEAASVGCIESVDDLATVPPPLRNLLTVPFVVLSMHTGKGPRALILADRAWQPDPTLSRRDLLLLEWFRSLAGMAWSVAELHAEIERAGDQLRELDTLKNSFLATISHELRTPLTAILGFLDLLLGARTEPLSEHQHGLLDRSRRHAHHLLGLVNDLLELAEHQAEGARALPVGRTDAHEALEAAMNHLAASPRWGRAHIVAPPPTDEACLVVANPPALERILFHLLENALKFSAAGSEVAVRFDRLDGNWHLAIADRGIGIERLQLRRIFSLFYQIDSRTTRAHTGMGIGLTLVKVLLDATGGHILVESEPGQGSVFTIVYPCWGETGQ